MRDPKFREITYDLLNNKGEKLEVPLEGSLSLLAAGYKGIMIWRQKKANALKAKEKNA